MKFKVDNQTFNDLEIFAARKDCKSVFDIFNSTCCLGGKNKLYNYLKAPLSNHIEINTDVRNSFFAVSTHTVEAAYKLENISSIQFSHLEIVRKGNIPTYTYKLKGGITEDRLGMYILEQENLIKTIKEINN